MKKASWFPILCAGILWGSMGIFVDELTALGFTTLQAAAFRICSATIIYIVFLAIKGVKYFKIKLCDFPVFAGLGILSILAMTCFYFASIQSTSYSIAAILLYTAPIMVSVMSAVFFKEKFTLQKTVALIIAFLGCVLISGLSLGNGIKAIGIIFGLLSGLAYALYSIFGTVALKKYHPYTVSTFAFVFASIGALVICDIPGITANIQLVQNIPALIVKVLLTGLITAFLPFMLYTIGLKNTEPGKAAIIACVEPLAATVFGVVKGQLITPAAAFGIIFILVAVVIVSIPGRIENR